jgi:rSAM/selenodomain-associated transferase 2
MISVIIPARNEAKSLPRLINCLHQIPQITEIILADGGSTDTTIEVAHHLGAVVIQGARGRGPQQNFAASFATSEILWFLHADALPSRGCGLQIQRASQKGAPGGNFRLSFNAAGFWPRLFESIARIQRRFGIYYGDSGIWTSRQSWDELGGFQAWPLFEDLDFARRLEKLAEKEGQRTACCPGRLRASARRFAKSPARVLWLWGCLQIAYEFGASTDKLASLYYGAGKS